MRDLPDGALKGDQVRLRPLAADKNGNGKGADLVVKITRAMPLTTAPCFSAIEAGRLPCANPCRTAVTECAG